MTLDDMNALLAKKGYYLMLSQSQNGQWSAVALGAHPVEDNGHLAYSRGSGFGKTPYEAMDALAAYLGRTADTLRGESMIKPVVAAKPKKKASVEELFG